MDVIERAVGILRAGGLVAFPTETVYGLGADASNSAAVRRIFAAKGRPGTNPLIVHVGNVAAAQRYAATWPESATQLTARFWPGPLTLVLPKAPSIVPEATAGLGTVGLRCPDHPLALRLLREFDGPVAAPSANRSTRVSPTTAEHVRQELGDAVDLILDGGPCRVGIESTVLDLSGPRPRILRPGDVSRQQIERVIGPVDLSATATPASQPALSPGQQAIHYAPAAKAYRFTLEQRPQVAQWFGEHASEPAALMTVGPVPAENGVRAALSPRHTLIEMPADPDAYARHLYGTLHGVDARGIGVLWLELPPDRPEWLAVRDRLLRATQPRSGNP